MKAFHIDQHQSVVFPLVETKVASLDFGLVDDILAHIVHATAAFVDGFPDHGFVRRTSGVWEGLILHPDSAPHVILGVEDGDIGIIGAVLQSIGKSSLVFVVVLEIRPPVVVLAVVGTIAYPAGELGFKIRRIVEAVENALGHARHGRLVASNLQLFKCHVEDGVGVGHLFAADGAVAGEMCCRRHEFVDHGIGTTAAVVGLRHFFTRFVF